MLLTRLPLGRLSGTGPPPDGGRCVWAYPLVGLAVGGIGGVAYAAATGCGVPGPVAACWTLAAQLLATGALHEDGLADVADGFGGGRTAARKLEIMRDSRIGSYGALALLLSLALRGTVIAALARPGAVAASLAASGALGRGGILLLLGRLGPARPDGMAASLGAPRRVRLGAGLVAAGLAAFLLLPAGAALRASCAAVFAAGCVGWLARRQIGGHTGDVLGAAAVVTECAALSVLAS